MLQRLFPERIDNRFPGHWAGLWVFGALVALKMVIGFNSVARTASVAQGADGIPLDRFAPDAVKEILSIFALLGLLHMTMALLCVIALVRYRALVPLLLALLLVERLARSAILWIHPGTPPLHAPPGNIVALVLAGLMLLGLVLALWPVSKNSGAGG